MRLFSHKLTDDTGFAPNPFHGVCTLATCKAQMHHAKRKGDWIAGFTSQKLIGDSVGRERLIYLMLVSGKLGLDEYHRNPAFAAKIPNPGSPGAPRFVDRAGDNICFLQDGEWKQVENPNHTLADLPDDTSGEFVLIAERDDRKH